MKIGLKRDNGPFLKEKYSKSIKTYLACLKMSYTKIKKKRKTGKKTNGDEITNDMFDNYLLLINYN